MKLYKFAFDAGYVGTDIEEVVELGDDLTYDEVGAEWRDWVWSHIDGTHTEAD